MISLSSLLPNIPANKLRELEIVTQRIIDTGHAEIIQLFGSYARGDFKPETDPRQPKKSDFDILVVTADEETQKKVSSKLYGAFHDIETVVQVIVDPIEDVNLKLQMNNSFYSDVKYEGKTLFTTDRFRFSKAENLSNVKRTAKAEHNFELFMGEAGDWETMADLAVGKNLYRKASFNLQQQTEILYKTVGMIFEDYLPYEHRLPKLRERAVQFDARMDNAFPLETEEGKFLFEHLDLAYIGSRYLSKELYDVSIEQINYWNTEIKKLMEITEVVCKEKIKKLRERE